MVSKSVLNSLKVKNNLNPKIWDSNDKLKENIREQLLSISKFYKKEIEEDLDVKIKIKDIILTGSLSNYNWSNYSDLDVHLLFDFSKIDNFNIVSKYLHKVKILWGYEHNIKINGFEVELYCQDINENHESTGVYSLIENDWITKPSKTNFKPDMYLIKEKSKIYMDMIDHLYHLHNDNYQIFIKKWDKIWNKMKKTRKSGLEEDGEF
jgi:hypothetical protein